MGLGEEVGIAEKEELCVSQCATESKWQQSHPRLLQPSNVLSKQTRQCVHRKNCCQPILHFICVGSTRGESFLLRTPFKTLHISSHAYHLFYMTSTMNHRFKENTMGKIRTLSLSRCWYRRL